MSQVIIRWSLIQTAYPSASSALVCEALVITLHYSVPLALLPYWTLSVIYFQIYGVAKLSVMEHTTFLVSRTPKAGEDGNIPRSLVFNVQSDEGAPSQNASAFMHKG